MNFRQPLLHHRLQVVPVAVVLADLVQVGLLLRASFQSQGVEKLQREGRLLLLVDSGDRMAPVCLLL
jgi:hypothetical protein